MIIIIIIIKCLNRQLYLDNSSIWSMTKWNIEYSIRGFVCDVMTVSLTDESSD